MGQWFDSQFGSDFGATQPTPLLTRGMRGKDVATWQGMVGAKVDSIFGPDTEARTKAFQTANGLKPDGKVGPLTWTKAYELVAKGVASSGSPGSPVSPAKAPTLTSKVVEKGTGLVNALVPTQKPFLAPGSFKKTPWGWILIGFLLAAGGASVMMGAKESRKAA